MAEARKESLPEPEPVVVVEPISKPSSERWPVSWEKRSRSHTEWSRPESDPYRWSDVQHAALTS